LEVEVTPACASESEFFCPSLQVELNGTATLVTAGGGANVETRTRRVCLGDAAYGGEVRMAIRPSLGNFDAQPPDCGAVQWPTIESLRITPAGDGACPEEDFLNGDFIGDEGWTLTGAAIDGGQLHLESGDRARAVVMVPPAEALAAPALRIEVDDGGPGDAMLLLGGVPWRELKWTARGSAGSRDTFFVCVPPWAQGAAHEITLLGRQQSAASDIDELRLVADSRCGDGSFGAGFERFNSGNTLGPGLGGWYERDTGTARVLDDAAAAGEVGVRTAEGDNELSLYGLVRMPQSEAGSGLAFAYRHRVVEGSSVNVTVFPYGVASRQFSSRVWETTQFCTGEYWAGQITPMWVYAIGTQETSFDLDDVGPRLVETCDPGD
jgi:hypothetical protein